MKSRISQTRSECQKGRLRVEYAELNKMVKKSARSDKRQFLENMAKAAGIAASKNEMRMVYKITQQICGEKQHSNTPVKDKQGTVLTSEEEQDKRWAEHFSEILNKPAPENPPDIAPATEDLDISTDAPTKQEIIKAVKTLKNNKTRRQDTLQAELLKINPDLAADLLLPLFETIWEQEQLPHDWTCRTIFKTPKKGNLSDCNNWRGITLLSVPSKVFCKVIMMPLVDAVDLILRKEQAGF